MNRFAQIAWLTLCCALVGSPAFGVDCSQGYVQGPGGYYRSDDRSGPYFINSACVATPMSGAVTTGGASSVDTVVQGAAVYRGGTITTANTSQQLMATSAARRGFTVQNQSTGDLYIKVGAAATVSNVSLRIAPGALYETQSQHASAGVVNIIGAATGQAFYATEY